MDEETCNIRQGCNVNIKRTDGELPGNLLHSNNING